MSDGVSGSSVGERVLAGSLWVGAWRWTARLIGVATTIIVARLLVPDDFGVFATALIVVSLFDMLFDLGTDLYLIRLEDPDPEDLNTAWTLRLVLTSATAAMVFLGAPIAAGFFADERLVDVFRVLALTSALRGCGNIGLTLFRRELRYARIASVGIAQRIVGSTTMVVLAFALGNYWALVLGEVALRVTELVLSYAIHPYRPRFCVTRFKAQWHFSQWLMVRNLATFFQGRSDQIVAAKYFGIEQIGIYAMAMRCAAVPTEQLTAPMRNPTYSGLARKQGDRAGFGHSVVQLFGATCVVVLPAAAYFVVMGEQLLVFLIGANWHATGPLIAPLVCAGAFSVIAQPAAAVLTLDGRVRLIAAIGWGAAFMLIAAMIVAAHYGTLVTLACARAALAAGLMAVYLACVVRTVGLSWGRLLGGMYRPLIAAVAAGLAAQTVAGEIIIPALDILATLVSAALVYPASLYLLWRAARRPEAGEALLMRNLVALIGRRRRHRS